MTQYYSYLWLREDGTPYYVGKGIGRRAYRTEHGVHRPTERSRILVFPQENEAEAFESEMAIIELFGRKDLGTGCLRNLTAGGEGTSGYKHLEDARAAITASLLGNTRTLGKKRLYPYPPVSEETRAKMAAAKLGKKRSPEFSAKQSARLKGVPRPPELMALLHSPEARKKAGEKRRGRKQSAEWSRKRWDARFLKTVAW